MTRPRTACGSTPAGANTRRPSGRSIAVIPSGGCTSAEASPARRNERQRRKLRALPLRHAEVHAPAEQQPREDPVLAHDLRDADAGLVALQRDG